MKQADRFSRTHERRQILLLFPPTLATVFRVTEMHLVGDACRSSDAVGRVLPFRGFLRHDVRVSHHDEPVVGMLEQARADIEHCPGGGVFPHGLGKMNPTLTLIVAAENAVITDDNDSAVGCRSNGVQVDLVSQGGVLVRGKLMAMRKRDEAAAVAVLGLHDPAQVERLRPRFATVGRAGHHRIGVLLAEFRYAFRSVPPAVCGNVPMHDEQGVVHHRPDRPTSVVVNRLGIRWQTYRRQLDQTVLAALIELGKLRIGHLQQVMDKRVVLTRKRLLCNVRTCAAGSSGRQSTGGRPKDLTPRNSHNGIV